MNIIQMFITFIVVVIGDHFIWLAFKAHTFIAATASNSIATIRSDDWHFTICIWTHSDSILLHVFLEKTVCS